MMMRSTATEGKAQVQQSDSPPASSWAAFRRLMLWVSLATAVAVAAGLWWLHATGAPARWELWAAAAGGIAGTMLLAGSLMGLLFLSNRSGHDASVGDTGDTPEPWPGESDIKPD